VQTGWTIGDRVLRPAMVGVSKGGPKAASRKEAATGENGI
jgi:molecular chaperone GrpE